MAEVVISARDQVSPVIQKIKADAASFATQINAIRFGALGLAAGALTAHLGSVAKSAINTGDQLFKLSQKVGISVERLSELRFAAELSDVSLEQFQTGMKGLNDALTKAADSTSREAQLLKALGVTARTPYEALRQLADAVKALPDGATKSAVAVDLLGKAGQNMIPFLNGGSAAIDAAADSARRLGLTLSTETAKQSEEFNDNMRKLRTGAESLGIALSTKLVGSLARYTGELVKAREQGSLWNGILSETIRLSLRAAEGLPGGLGALAQAGSARLAAGDALARAQEAQRTATGKIRGAQESTVDPDVGARAACVIAGGTWDAAARRCVPKSAGPKGPTLNELLSQSFLTGLRAQEEEASRLIAEAEKANQENLEQAASVDLRRIERFEAAEDAADEQIARNRELARSYVDLVDPAAQYIRKLDEIRRLHEQGFLDADQAREAEFAIQSQVERINQLAEDTDKASDFARELGLTMTSAFESAVISGNKARDVVRGLLKDIAQVVLRKSVTEPLGKAASKVLDKVLGTLGFAQGGSFVVGGGGGTDSQLVAFRATPNERVTIETPEQQARSRGANTFNFSIDARGADAGVAQRIERAVTDAVQLSLQAVQAQADRGGAFARAVGRR